MDLKLYIGNKIKHLRTLHGMTQTELAEKLFTTKQTVSRYENGQRSADQDVLFELCEIFNVSINDFFPQQHSNTPTLSSDVQAIVDVSVQLETTRQHKVLNYAKKQLNDQNNEKEIDISVLKESSTTYQEKQLFPVQVTEGLAAGRGYSYNENNETVTVYTDRDNLQWHNLASFIIGDSMEPKYHNGDVVLIQKGFDNIQGAVYAVDYNNKTYMKKLYNDGHQFRLVSINDKYDDILIDIPVDEDIYFNIVGRVVDSFTPVEE